MLFLNGSVVEVKHFSDGTQKLSCLTRKETQGRDHVITWLYEREEEVVTLAHIVNHLRHYDPGRIVLKMPYVPNARMDRQEKDSDVLTLESIGVMINNMGFAEVQVFDPHSRVTMGVIRNTNVISPKELIGRAIFGMDYNCNMLLYYPDRGAMDRYKNLFPNMNHLYGEKHRDWDTAEITSLEICGNKDLVPGSKVLMIDDICSSGGTLLRSAKELKALGAKEICIYVSHCEKRVLTSELLSSGLITTLFTSNSLFNNSHIEGNETRKYMDGYSITDYGTMKICVFDVF